MKKSPEQFKKEEVEMKTTSIESKERPISNLLIVEDDSDCQNAAQNFFTGGEVKINVDYAGDYQTAEKLLKEKKYDGVITDLFFPKNADDLSDTELGKKVLKKIRERLRLRWNCKIEHCPGYFFEIRDIEEKEQMRELERLLKDKSTQNKKSKHFSSISKKDQPLGVLVVEEAKKKGIPYVIVTTGHAAHGSLASPVAAYLALEGLIKYTRGERRGFVPSMACYDKISRSLRDPFDFDKGIPTEKEYIEFRHKQSEERGYTKNTEEYLRKDYKELLLYHFNPFISDISKTHPRHWKEAFYKLFHIAMKQKGLIKIDEIDK